MGLHNLLDQLKNAPIPLKSGGIQKMFNVKGLSGRAMVLARVAPSGSETGYAQGCMWFDLNGKKLYINTGDATSATWDDFSQTLDESFATLATRLDTVCTDLLGNDLETYVNLEGVYTNGAAAITFLQSATGLAATDVHAAIEETWTEKASKAGDDFSGTVGFQNIGADAFDAAALELLQATGGGGMKWTSLKKTHTLGGAVAAVDLGANTPAVFVPKLVCLNIDALIGCTTAVKIGVGVSGDEDKYGKTGDLLKNTKITNYITSEAAVAAEDIQVYSVDTGGSAAGTMDSGSFTVIVSGWEVIPITDAA